MEKMIKKFTEFMRKLDKYKIISKSNVLFDSFLDIFLKNNGYSKGNIENLRESSIEDLNNAFRWIFHRKYRRKLLEFLLGDHMNLKKEIEDELTKTNDFETNMILIYGYKFIELLKERIGKPTHFKIITNIFYRSLLYDVDRYTASEILLKLIPSHRYNQQVLFETIQKFIVKFVEEYGDYFDDRNKEAIAWAKLVSELKNPETNEVFFKGF